jgi:hypothetical protein
MESVCADKGTQETSVMSKLADLSVSMVANVTMALVFVPRDMLVLAAKLKSPTSRSFQSRLISDMVPSCHGDASTTSVSNLCPGRTLSTYPFNLPKHHTVGTWVQAMSTRSASQSLR